jgi:hypothetical protein
MPRLDRGGGSVLHALVGGVHVWRLPYPCPSQGRSREPLVEVTTQRPAANTPGLHVHQHGQGPTRLAHTDGGDIAAPHLIRANDLQLAPQISVARIGMGAVGRAGMPHGALSLPTHLAHEARPMLPGNLHMLTVRERRDAPIAVAGPGAREALDGGLERRLVTALSAVIVAAPRAREHVAELAYGLGLAEHSHDLPHLGARGCKMPVAFLKMSCSTVRRPTRRSHAAPLVASW